jgi:hypothetical protein
VTASLLDISIVFGELNSLSKLAYFATCVRIAQERFVVVHKRVLQGTHSDLASIHNEYYTRSRSAAARLCYPFLQRFCSCSVQSNKIPRKRKRPDIGGQPLLHGGRAINPAHGAPHDDRFSFPFYS